MIFIPNNVPSLKNGRDIFNPPNAGYPMLIKSKSVKKYLRIMGIKDYRTRLDKKQKAAGVLKVEEYVKRPNLFRQYVGDYFEGVEYPVVVKFFFVRSSKRRFDFTNAVDIIADLLTAHDFIIDDDMGHFIPMPMRSEGKWYSVDPEKPGVWLEIVKINEVIK